MMLVLPCRLQQAHLQVDNLQAELQRWQLARSDPDDALRQRRIRWAELMEKVQEWLDRVDPHSSDARFLSRVRWTARTRYVETLLEQQAT